MRKDTSRFLLSPPELTGQEGEAIGRVLESGWLAPLGPEVDAFEAELAQVAGAAAGAATSSGTAALHLALLLAGVEPGTEVIVPTLTFIATANPVLYCGATPVFLDSSPASWNLDPELLAEELECAAARGRRVSAVIVVHLFGQSADMDPILDVCRRYGVPLVEDAAEALGATYRGRPVGGLGDFGVFSFNGNKIITTSGGGMLVSSNVSMIERARFLASQAREAGSEYRHKISGFNYRMSNILAAVGRAQLCDLSRRVERKRWIHDGYRSHLADIPTVRFMPDAGWGLHTRWLTTLTVGLDETKDSRLRDIVIDALHEQGIEARPVWRPMHRQPVFAGAKLRGTGVSDEIFRAGVCLPSGLSLLADDLALVSEVVRDAIRAA